MMFLHVLLFSKFTNHNSICLLGQSSLALFFSPEKGFVTHMPIFMELVAYYHTTKIHHLFQFSFLGYITIFRIYPFQLMRPDP